MRATLVPRIGGSRIKIKSAETVVQSNRNSKERSRSSRAGGRTGRRTDKKWSGWSREAQGDWWLARG